MRKENVNANYSERAAANGCGIFCRRPDPPGDDLCAVSRRAAAVHARRERRRRGHERPARAPAQAVTQFLRDRLRGKTYLPLAYFDGATPQNGYTPSRPYTLQVLPDLRPQDVEPGYLRVYLKTAGADSPRPMKLRQKGTNWYLWEYSSILSGIRIPVQDDPWA